jgi:diguanylate cyclase (GGDEF)-like protein
MAHQKGLLSPDEPAEAWHGPALTFLTHVFCDPAIERRYLAAAATQDRGRLAGVLLLATLLSLAGAAGFVLPPADAAPPMAWVPNALQTGVCLLTAAILLKLRRPRSLETLAFLFGVLFAAASCIVLALRPDDAGAAMLVGAITLLYVGLPVRLPILAPLMATLSGALIAAWSVRDPMPSAAAVISLCAWAWVMNLMGLMAVRTVRRALRVQWAQAQALHHAAAHDDLTGLLNRRAFDRALMREWANGQRSGNSLSLVMLDADHFQLQNNCAGHGCGDECLRDIAAAVESCLQGPGEIAARIGNDAFACLLPNTGEQGARGMAERMMTLLRGTAVAHPCGPQGPFVTFSIGVATARPVTGHSAWELSALAENLVSNAKMDGRNHIRQHTLGAPRQTEETGLLADAPGD